MTFRTVRWIALCAILLFTPGLAAGQTVRAASGLDAASITPVRDQFRADLGGGTVAGANGSFGGLRREINWDGVPAAFLRAKPSWPRISSTQLAAWRRFLHTRYRLSGERRDDRCRGWQPAAADFGNIDPSYTATFAPFSAQRLFTSLGSNVTDVTFFLPARIRPRRRTGSVQFSATWTSPTRRRSSSSTAPVIRSAHFLSPPCRAAKLSHFSGVVSKLGRRACPHHQRQCCTGGRRDRWRSPGRGGDG
jgi:hypothetical protein